MAQDVEKQSINGFDKVDYLLYATRSYILGITVVLYYLL